MVKGVPGGPVEAAGALEPAAGPVLSAGLGLETPSIVPMLV